MLTRRQMLRNTALAAGLSPLACLGQHVPAATRKSFRFGACDWSLGKSADPAAFDIAKQIGLEGIMVNMGTAADKLRLRERSVQDAYLQAARKTGIVIASLAIAELNQTPYKSDPITEEWVWDSIDAAQYLGAPVVLLAFFNKNDLRNDDTGKKEVIRRLKKVAGKAERQGIILGIESYLSASEHLAIIEQVGSKNIKVYLDCRNTADAGLDVLKEIKILGMENICELHIKENGFLLGQGTMNWPAIADLLYQLHYFGDGWLQLEWALPEKTDLIKGYQHNLQFLRQLFHKEVNDHF